MKTSLFLVRANRLSLLTIFFLISVAVTTIQAQARLSIQGILKKIDGTALADGSYNLKFRIYADSVGGTVLWTEIQNVELNGGVYSAVLGAVNPLNVPFDQAYYVGVAIGTAAEMLPRIPLTSAPYALSLIGQNNKFPSIGTVRADNQIVVDKLAVGQGALPVSASLEVGGGVLARGGAPGGLGVLNNGYAFGAGGDNDSGLFSLTDNSVSLFANSVERMQVNDNGVQVLGNASVSGNMGLVSNGHLTYNGIDDWRLAYRNDFETGAEGWSAYDAIYSAVATGTTTPALIWLPLFPVVTAGNVAKPTAPPTGNPADNDVMKRQYDLSAFPHTHVRVRFTYHFIDTWDGGTDRGWAGIAKTNSQKVLLGWCESFQGSTVNGQAMNVIGNFNESDFSKDVEMTFKTSDNSIWLFIGANLNSSDEDYAIDNVEIWVR